MLVGSPAARRTSPPDAPIDLTARALALAIGRGQLSAEEAVRACIQQIESVNPRINAVVQLLADAAVDAARAADRDLAHGRRHGPLHGVPMTIKDSLDTAGVITTAGTAGRADFVPTRDATVVARLKRAGAILVGKTNTPELTLSGETENTVYGRTNNPWDLERTPGGSSGGAAAIVAAKGVPFDIGSDTGGSIRWPAHCCGIAGIKPTSGRVARTGHVVSFEGMLQSLTQLGPLARSVDDLELVLQIIAGPDGYDPHISDVPLRDRSSVALDGVRVAVYFENGLIAPTPAARETAHAAASALEDAGASLTEVAPPHIGEAHQILQQLLVGDSSWVERLLAAAGTTQSPLVDLLREAQPLALREYSALVERADAYRSSMLQFMTDFDVLVCPAAPAPATRHGDYTFALESLLSPYNLVGLPAVVIRAGTSPEGLPLGVQLIGRAWRCDVALAAAQHVEAALGPWPDPPGSAR